MYMSRLHPVRQYAEKYRSHTIWVRVGILVAIGCILIFSYTILNNYILNFSHTLSSEGIVSATSSIGIDETHFHYIQITAGCGPYYQINASVGTTSTCVNMRSGPGVQYPVVGRLRTGVVLKVEDQKLQSGYGWYKIIFDGDIRYPERVKGDWYVKVDPLSVLPLINIGDKFQTATTTKTNKRIVVDVSSEILTAYDGNIIFMQESISTGLELTPTSRGTFSIFKKTPSRYMQGPLPGVSDQVYDLPGVPWNLYFTHDGAVIHGAYWHDHFGHPYSHGCVNLSPDNAKKLYLWADIGTLVVVQD